MPVPRTFPGSACGLLSHGDSLAAAYLLARSDRPLRPVDLQYARGRPLRSIRRWLLTYYMAGLVDRKRTRRGFTYSATARLQQLLDWFGVEEWMLESPGPKRRAGDGDDRFRTDTVWDLQNPWQCGDP